METETLTHRKIQELFDYFSNTTIEEGEKVQLDNCTSVVDVKKFINFSTTLLTGEGVITRLNKPYIIRLHKLRLYYEQKRTHT